MTNILAKRLSSFGELPLADCELLGRIVDAAPRLSLRDKLPAEGSRTTSIHLLLKGWAYRYKLVESGKRQIIALLLPGETIEPYELEGGLMDHSVGLLDGAIVARLDPDDLSAAAAQSAILNRAMRRSNQADVAVLRQWLVNIGRRNSLERLAHLFCELWVRASEVDMVSGNEMTLPLTQEHLADATALTAVHLNRTLRTLREQSLIHLRWGRLTILDMPALRAAAAFDARYLGLQLSADASKR